ncbi:PEP-CTERM sorting domain-containing protein [Anabaena sphaerica FACHB-251]|uniref:PEP-CTERM sorting domain-containing protein n=1 Tax=Anabaena sphaerica FACHB-251 TaxID=2692883 RepID=A0A926WJU1_9NOST|nr:XDD3 family exosortase-dependent surface protein [Anabaena sphaerica]MBD2295818.1 PEP-CTERM sorting domain-containing protein [Anabaena sphaerica FACHB-251]
MLCQKATKLLLGLLATSFGLISTSVQPAHASSLLGEWYYTIDSFNDGLSPSVGISDSPYEIYGMAMKETANEITFAINTNLPAGGISNIYAQDFHVAWGDLLLNFTGKSLDVANAASELFGVHWAVNESGVPELGVYQNVTAKAIAQENGLLLQDASLRGYNNRVISKGGNPFHGDLGMINPYFNENHHVQNVIATGTKIGDVNVLNDVSNLGLNFAHFGATGTQTLAFSFSRKLLPDGSFIVHLSPECDNDLIAMVGNLKTNYQPPQSVPEPSTLLPLGVMAVLFVASRQQRRS